VTSENTQMHKKSAQTHKLGYTDAYTNEKSVDRARPLRTENTDAQMHKKVMIIIFLKYDNDMRINNISQHIMISKVLIAIIDNGNRSPSCEHLIITSIKIK
jgi:hypothetical protein